MKRLFALILDNEPTVICVLFRLEDQWYQPLNERIFNEIATMIAQKRTGKCTRKCRQFQCLRDNNNGFEEPNGYNK